MQIEMVRVVAIICYAVLLIFISIYDVIHHRIENFVHFILLAVSLLAFELPFGERVVGAVVVALPFFLVSFFSGKIGMGDAKLMLCFGFAIGIRSVIGMIVGLLLMIIIGGIYQIILQKNTPIALAPFLCIGFGIVNIL